MMKKNIPVNKLILINALILSFALTGCSRSSEEARDERTEENVFGQAQAQIAQNDASAYTQQETAGPSGVTEGEAAPDTDAEKTDATAGIENPAVETEKSEDNEAELTDYPDKYRDALSEFKESLKLPDGTAVKFIGDGDISDAEYCMADVDSDGVVELVIKYDGSYIEPDESESTGTYRDDFATESEELPKDAFEAVYEYDPVKNSFICELYEVPDIVFFENGIATITWRPTQSLSDSKNSYSIYEYSEDSRNYQYAGFVDSWNKELHPTDFEKNSFPDKLDLDGDGLIYAVQYFSEYNYGYIYDSSVRDELEKRLLKKTLRLTWYGV